MFQQRHLPGIEVSNISCRAQNWRNRYRECWGIIKLLSISCNRLHFRSILILQILFHLACVPSPISFLCDVLTERVLFQIIQDGCRNKKKAQIFINVIALTLLKSLSLLLDVFHPSWLFHWLGPDWPAYPRLKNVQFQTCLGWAGPKWERSYFYFILSLPVI